MKGRVKATVMALMFFASGCAKAGSAGPAVIVNVRCGSWDGCSTIVEFLDDRSRWARNGDWGEVGDTIRAQRVVSGGDGPQWWTSPTEPLP